MSVPMPDVSIIVPVYKAEKYILRCLDSLLSQTLSNFELLLIDDGSPDNSGAICDEYAAKDSRIRVFHKENGGVASARQIGIDNARGEYSIHCDPDDWVDTHYLERLFNKASEEDADMVICDFVTCHDEKRTINKQMPKSLYHKDLLKQVLNDEIHGVTWNKLIRTNLYSKYQISFPNNINYMEDTFVICRLLSKPIHISYIADALYFYDRSTNKDSLTKKTEGTRFKSNLVSLRLFIDELNEVIPSADFTYRKILYKKYLWETFDVTKDEFLNKYHEVNDVIIAQYKNKENKIVHSLYVAIKYGFLVGRFFFLLENIRAKLYYIMKSKLL